MQSVSSRIWTRVAVSISYDDNHYTMGTSQNFSYNTKDISSVGNPVKASLVIVKNSPTMKNFVISVVM